MRSCKSGLTKLLVVAAAIIAWGAGALDARAAAQEGSTYGQYPEGTQGQQGAPAGVSAPATVPAPLTETPAVPGSSGTRTNAPPSMTETPAPVPAPGGTSAPTGAGPGMPPETMEPRGETPPSGMAPPPAAPAPAPAEPAPAPAETNVYIEQPPAPVAVVPPAAPVVMTPSRTRLGAGVLVGGGVVDFSRDQARADTGVGGYWDVRAVVGTRTFVGLEAAYHGTAQAIDTLGLSNNAALVGNGVEGALRLNIPIAVGRSLVEPFGFLGMGWSHYNVVNSDTGSASISDPDDVLTAPFGAGFAYGYAGFVADARFTYRPTYYNDLLRTTNGSSDRLDNWSVGGQVGFEF